MNRKIALYARLANLAYTDIEGVPFISELADLKVKLLATFKNNDTGAKGFIVQDGNDIGIVMGYGKKYADWLPEFSSATVELANNLGSMFSVNKEFTATFSSIKNVIIELFKSRETPANFEWVGHGAGGAIATLGAFWTSQWPAFSTKLYTFGSPRVGDKRFVDLLNDKVTECHRVVGEGDLIPGIPLIDNQGQWYKHVKGKMAVHEGGKVVIVSTTPFYERVKVFKRKIETKLFGDGLPEMRNSKDPYLDQVGANDHVMKGFEFKEDEIAS